MRAGRSSIATVTGLKSKSIQAIVVRVVLLIRERRQSPTLI
jgi:hypothetical protein